MGFMGWHPWSKCHKANDKSEQRHWHVPQKRHTFGSAALNGRRSHDRSKEGRYDELGDNVERLPIGTKRGNQKLQYIWDGQKIKVLSPAQGKKGTVSTGRLVTSAGALRDRLWLGFFPSPKSVTPDYWEFIRWRCCQRFFSTIIRLFGTQSLLMAVGVGGRKALTTSAGINWILKDGLGRLARMTMAARYGDVFDSNLKRMRFQTSILFSACILCEILTPAMRQHFLLLASVANVGKAIALTTSISTSPALSASFCRGHNLADITAKAQAQHMVVDSLALAVAASLMRFCQYSVNGISILPMAAYPVCTAFDLYAVYRELKAVELRNLSSERVQMIAHDWVHSGQLKTPKEVSRAEKLLGHANVCDGFLPLSIGPLEGVASNPAGLHELMRRHRKDKYLLGYKQGRSRGSVGTGKGESIVVSLSDEATPRDTVTAILQATHLRSILQGSHCGKCSENRDGAEQLSTPQALDESHRRARQGVDQFMKELTRGGWETKPFLLSSKEKQGYVLL